MKQKLRDPLLPYGFFFPLSGDGLFGRNRAETQTLGNRRLFDRRNRVGVRAIGEC